MPSAAQRSTSTTIANLGVFPATLVPHRDLDRHRRYARGRGLDPWIGTHARRRSSVCCRLMPNLTAADYFGLHRLRHRT
jgi:hypothetical protein